MVLNTIINHKISDNIALLMLFIFFKLFHVVNTVLAICRDHEFNNSFGSGNIVRHI